MGSRPVVLLEQPAGCEIRPVLSEVALSMLRRRQVDSHGRQHETGRYSSDHLLTDRVEIDRLAIPDLDLELSVIPTGNGWGGRGLAKPPCSHYVPVCRTILRAVARSEGFHERPAPQKRPPIPAPSPSAAPASTISRTSTSTSRATSWWCITGLSGSGKSSLAFDTIYAEGQRRYVESLSAYARQFLEQMQKPDVD